MTTADQLSIVERKREGSCKALALADGGMVHVRKAELLEQSALKFSK